MKKHVRIPLRRKILFSVMLGLTGTVGLITFTMARFFHEDKQAYINDWITTATVSTADDCHSCSRGTCSAYCCIQRSCSTRICLRARNNA